MRKLVVLTAAVALALGLRATATTQPPSTADLSCTATAANPVAVCFPPQPFTLIRCKQVLRPSFSVDLWHVQDGPSVGYRYAYQLIVDGAPVGSRKTFDGGNPDAFAFTTSPDLSTSESFLPYSGAASYSLRVTIYPEGGRRPFEATSPPLSINDPARVRGLAVGVSRYRTPEYNLNFADEDAAVFHKAMTTLLAPTDIAIDLHTTTRGAELNPNMVLAAISEVATRLGPSTVPPGDNEPLLCGPDDWFVFYYSGHGVVGVNENTNAVGRYISTTFLNPAKLASTAVRITELATRLADTNARNLLVILDSCFSGNFVTPAPAGTAAGRAARSATSPAATRSAKVLFVDGNNVVPYQIPGKGDSQVFQHKIEQLALDERGGLILAAAGLNQLAEEGPVHYSLENLEFTRGSVAEHRGRRGYGLFTFAWLANLLTQVPASMKPEVLLPGGRTPTQVVECHLNFKAAAEEASTDIRRMGRGPQWTLQAPLQEPDVRATEVLPRALSCARAEAQ